MGLKSRASLTFFRACFLPGQAKDLSALRYVFVKEGRLAGLVTSCVRTAFENITERNIEGIIDGPERHGRRCRQLLESLDEEAKHGSTMTLSGETAFK